MHSSLLNIDVLAFILLSRCFGVNILLTADRFLKMSIFELAAL